MLLNEIEELKNQFVSQLMPISIYLFGSYATDTYTEDLSFLLNQIKNTVKVDEKYYEYADSLSR